MNNINKAAEPLSRETLLKRGSCCNLGCVNCPWGFKKENKETIRFPQFSDNECRTK